MLFQYVLGYTTLPIKHNKTNFSEDVAESVIPFYAWYNQSPISENDMQKIVEVMPKRLEFLLKFISNWKIHFNEVNEVRFIDEVPHVIGGGRFYEN